MQETPEVLDPDKRTLTLTVHTLLDGLVRQTSGFAFVSKSVQHRVQKGRSSAIYRFFNSWITVSVIGAGLMAGGYTAATRFGGSSASTVQVAAAKPVSANMVASLARSLPHLTTVDTPGIQAPSAPSLALNGRSEPLWYNHFGRDQASHDSRFDSVVEKAELSPEKLAKLFKQAKPAAVDTKKSVRVALAEPAKERFAADVATTAVASNAATSIALAYADPSPEAQSGALAALAQVAPVEDELLSNGDVEAGLSEQNGQLLDEGDLPDSVPVPFGRPRSQAAKPADLDAAPATEESAEEKVQPADRAKRREKPVQLAYARPDDPVEQGEGGGLGRAFKNLFGARPKAGNGVAVYDISAAKVYMPDGTVLEAHSGIGRMADNPRYANVKMNGPTPPHTYNLKMRESRFHGVEAIRMLPVDGKNKHGRDGFLTHSYLLRGGRAESHGCVAFKDYNKFLGAFKRGKVRQLVVVPGGGRAIARNGRKARDV